MRSGFIMLMILVTTFSINTHADVLKWIDENGTTHYSNKEKKLSRNKGKVFKFVEYQSSKVNDQTTNKSESKSSLDENGLTSTPVNTASTDSVSYNEDRESIDELATENPEDNRITQDQLNSPKSYIQRKSRNTRRNTRQKPEYTIAEYNQRCEDAREELIAPLRQEAIHSCMRMKHSMTRRTRDYCEEINQDFGDGGMNSRGFYIQRMFHNIPECQEAYEAWGRRSRKMRGYSE